ncbi:hypothetical protein EX30DRAFT_385563 [Ascodesmis nigricans]|uniref:Uncharacterized protein n=1 Tax=Ascodesmis nigricans TaxID=341454 RepID=A0A4S2MMP1_9PEZI|nr:hypothetical protein EX30DRAFT_385563 [Ascodesmis nigricans]
MNPPLPNTNPSPRPPSTPLPISNLASQLAAHPPPTTFSTGSPSKRPIDDSNLFSARSAKQSKMSSSSSSECPGALLAPFTPAKRPTPTSNRLSLQMPSRGPLSPVLDPVLGYSVARRPRLDFSRACTSLHHTTLAESSPDSSPLASGGFAIPSRNHHNRSLDSPIGPIAPGSSHASSLGSQCMLDYAPSADSSDSSSDDDLDDTDIDDALAASLSSTTTSATKLTESAATLSLRNHQKARQGNKPWRRHHHNHHWPFPGGIGRNPGLSPTLRAGQRGFVGMDVQRRDMLDLGPAALEAPGEVGVVRRPVSRRGSLLPKTKNFQRIKAALIEESCPVDVEVKREAEITRQIREEDEPVSVSGSPYPSPQKLLQQHLQHVNELGMTLTPSLAQVNSTTPTTEGAIPAASATPTPQNRSFQEEAQRHGGFWFSDQMEGIVSPLSGTPFLPPLPPPPRTPSLSSATPQRQNSDGDIIMSTDDPPPPSSSSLFSTPFQPPFPPPPTPLRSSKRRRTHDDLLEPGTLKRRAVSPSVCASPVMAQGSPGRGRWGMGVVGGVMDTSDGLMNMSLQ